MGYITGMVVVATITLGIYKLFELFAGRQERLELIGRIDKLNDPLLVNEWMRALRNHGGMFSSMRLACLLIGMGLGLLIGFFICAQAFPSYLTGESSNWRIEELTTTVYGASVLLCGGLGLLIAFLIEMKQPGKPRTK